MAHMGFCDKHNMVAFLQKPARREEFHQIVDFLADSHVRYALVTNPTIYVSLIEQFWQTATVKTLNDGEQQIIVTVDEHNFTITEASVTPPNSLQRKTRFGMVTSWREEDLIREIDLCMPIYQCRLPIYSIR
ncbi:hypothetical protein Tco_1071568 [Tanacetum coccineum]